MGSGLRLERRDGVAWITIDRPAARNALTPAMCRELVDIVRSLREDREARVVVLRATGADFTVGADLKEISGALAPDAAQRALDIPALARETTVPLVTGLDALPQPIVASLRGHVIGIGAQLALCADLVVASETARLLMPQVRLAHPVDHGESWYLPRRIGPARALQLLLLAETLAAPDALRWGLYNWVVPDSELEERTREVVQRLGAVAPVAAARIKALLRASPASDLPAQLEAEMQALAACAATEDFPEALDAFVAKRRPVFKGR